MADGDLDIQFVPDKKASQRQVVERIGPFARHAQLYYEAIRPPVTGSFLCARRSRRRLCQNVE